MSSSKFRARQLDASKPIPIYLEEDIADCAADLSNNASNRTVPQMPTGMEKEEETEHHLQQAIFHHRVIPVPEVYHVDTELINRLYPSDYKVSRQLVHIHPFSAEQDIPDYDLDSEDDVWLSHQAAKGELLPFNPGQFEAMMDRLEKSSGLKAVTLQEAKLLLKDDDDIITAVYDYWLNKRLRLQHALIPQVKIEKGVGSAPSDPYVAFRKRTEKMQTRKNRKNDEASYEKMLKLRRDLVRSSTMLQMISRREKIKRELLHLHVEVFEKRYEMGDFTGAVLNDILSSRAQLLRHAFTPLLSNHLNSGGAVVVSGSSPLAVSGVSMVNNWIKVPNHSPHISPQHTTTHRDKVSRKRTKNRRERKQNKRLKQNHYSASQDSQHAGYSHPPDPYMVANAYPQTLGLADDDADAAAGEGGAATAQSDEDSHPDGVYTFYRRHNIQYHAPRNDGGAWAASHEGGRGMAHCQYSLISLPEQYGSNTPPTTDRCLSLARRRVGRGGRIWVDRVQFNSMCGSNHDHNGLTPNTVQLLSNIQTAADSWSTGGGDEDCSIQSYSLPTFVAPTTVSSFSDMELDNGPSRPATPTSPSPALSSLIFTAEVTDGVNEGSATELSLILAPAVEDSNGGVKEGVQEPPSTDCIPFAGQVELEPILASPPPQQFLLSSPPRMRKHRRHSGKGGSPNSPSHHSTSNSRQFSVLPTSAFVVDTREDKSSCGTPHVTDFQLAALASYTPPPPVSSIDNTDLVILSNSINSSSSCAASSISPLVTSSLSRGSSLLSTSAALPSSIPSVLSSLNNSSQAVNNSQQCSSNSSNHSSNSYSAAHHEPGVSDCKTSVVVATTSANVLLLNKNQVTWTSVTNNSSISLGNFNNVVSNNAVSSCSSLVTVCNTSVSKNSSYVESILPSVSTIAGDSLLLTTSSTTTSDNNCGTNSVNTVDNLNKLPSDSSTCLSFSTPSFVSLSSSSVTSTERPINNSSTFSLSSSNVNNNNSDASYTRSNNTSNTPHNHHHTNKVLTPRTSSNNVSSTLNHSLVKTSSETISNGPSSRNNVILNNSSGPNKTNTTTQSAKYAKLDQYLFRDS